MTFAVQFWILITLSASTPSPPPLLHAPIPPPVEQHTLTALPQSRARDHWFSEDKLRHFFMSFATVAYSYGATRIVTVEHDAALTISLAAGAVAGLGKEMRDKRHGSIFSVKDLAWDAAGLAVGFLLIHSGR